MKLSQKKIAKALSGGLVLGTALAGMALPANAANLTSASVLLSTSRPSQSATYTLRFNPATGGVIRCISGTFVTTATGSTAVTGMDASSGVLGTLVNLSGTWALATGQAANVIKLTSSAGATVANTDAIQIPVTTVTNGSSEGTYFAQLATFSDEACSTGVDSVTVAYRIQNGVTVSVTVDPTLTFNVAGIAAGAVFKTAESSNQVSTGCTDTATAVTFPASMLPDTDYTCAQSLTTSTNGDGGYTVTLRGIHTTGNFLKATVNSISDHSGSNATPAAWPTSTGQTAFGYTTDDASLSGTTGRFSAADTWAGVPIATAPAEVAYNSGPIASDAVKIGYRMRFSAVTKAGAYSGTIVYVATPIF